MLATVTVTRGFGADEATALVTADAFGRPGPHAVVGLGQVHDGRGARVHFADGQALEVRPVNGGQARPRGLVHGQLKVEQVHHVVDGRIAVGAATV